ncbi:Os07g0631050 [Oryza sativa Japonica Group]|uniref:Os07g0631050 protein n=1 Tax=Oryza sativa subsp. japonica TaxID=39947 RepID=A0A0P0X9A7_ORYSJ|nr:hypothetical protein EE612_040835 [Oryza sativa]BAT02771.1 Os07g0631050 [Oryza sativa Japonica Group]
MKGVKHTNDPKTAHLYHHHGAAHKSKENFGRRRRMGRRERRRWRHPPVPHGGQPEPDRGEVMEPGASPEPVAGGEDDEQPWEGGCQRRISPEELPGQAEGRRGMRGARERVGRDWGEKMEGVHTRR